ncbi:hypothetical protein KJ671_03710 [Patescibacteria group bacterium]|nr:hypothetical protein [Patescibacteria group bacterium]
MVNIIVIIGILLIALGTYLTGLGTSIENKKTTKKLQESIELKNNQIDELVLGKDTVIQQNKDLNEKIEKYQKELDEKQQKINELEKFAKKDIYKPISEELKNQIINNITSLKDKSFKEIEIGVFDGNNNSKRIRLDVINLLKASGLDAKPGGTGISFGKSPSRPSMKMNKKSQSLANELANSLSPYIRTQFQGAIDDKLEDGKIIINIYGNPLFHENGAIEFQ